MRQRTNIVTIDEVSCIDRIEIRPVPLDLGNGYVEINIYLPPADLKDGMLSFDRDGFRNFRNAVNQANEVASKLADEIGEDD